MIIIIYIINNTRFIVTPKINSVKSILLTVRSFASRRVPDIETGAPSIFAQRKTCHVPGTWGDFICT